MKVLDRYKKAKEEYKVLEVKFIYSLKSYLTGMFFSILILSIYFAVLANLTIFNFWLVYVQIGIYLLLGVFIYLMLLFKDKAMIEYDNRCKQIDLLIIRIFDFLEIFIIVTIVFVIYMIFFRWW